MKKASRGKAFKTKNEGNAGRRNDKKGKRIGKK
jgi:hypothetical protein